MRSFGGGFQESHTIKRTVELVLQHRHRYGQRLQLPTAARISANSLMGNVLLGWEMYGRASGSYLRAFPFRPEVSIAVWRVS
jgi:hypothetical protein